MKVMPEHLQTYQDATEYAAKLLKDNPAEKVLLRKNYKGLSLRLWVLRTAKIWFGAGEL